MRRSSISLLLMFGLASLLLIPAAALAADKPAPGKDAPGKAAPGKDAPAKDAAAKPDATPAAPASPEAAEAIEKQIKSIEDRLTDMMKDEIKVNQEIMGAQQKVNVAAGAKAAKLPEEAAKGSNAPEVKMYRDLQRLVAQKTQATDRNFLPIMKQIKSLEKDRDQASPELKKRIDDIILRVNLKRRGNLEKVGDAYDKAGDFKNAIATFSAIVQMVPEAKRKAERPIIERIGDCYKKAGDFKSALPIYKELFEAIPENKRFADKTLGPSLAACCEKVGDMKTALEIYKGLLDAMPADKKEKEGKKYQDKINAIEKLANGKSTATPGKSSSDNNKRRY